MRIRKKFDQVVYYVTRVGEEDEINKLGGNFLKFKYKRVAERFVNKQQLPETYVITESPVVLTV